LTDPLTGKQLVEKSYDYVDKLTKECSRALLQEFNASHRKFDQKRVGSVVGESVVQWFAKRDRNVRLNLEPVTANQQPNVARLRFSGRTKDAQFSIGATLGTFSVPSGDGGGASSFVKTLVFSVDKASFAKPPKS
jgi:hypothetical protein